MSRRFAAPRRTATPRWLRAVLLRGLAPRREDRFPDMEALARVLQRDRLRWPRRAAGALAVAGVVAAAWLGRASTVEPCEEAGLGIEATWGEAPRVATRDVLVRLDSRAGPARAALVESRLDAYAAAWSELRGQACWAHAHGHESSHVLELRYACLDRRRAELAALGRALLEVDAEGGREAPLAAAALIPVSECADVARLRRGAQEPEDPAKRDAVAALREILARASALETLAQLGSARPLAEAAVREAEAVGFPPVHAEALVRRGAIELDAGEHARAEASLLEAARVAAEAGADEVEADAWLGLLWVVGVEQQRLAEGTWLSRMAEAAVMRAGEPARTRITWLHYTAVLEKDQQRLDAALVHEQQALALEQASGRGPSHELVTSLKSMGLWYRERGEPEPAEAYLQQALAAAQALYGEHHPSSGHVYNDLALVAADRGQWALAREQLQRAIDVFTETRGPDHPSTLLGMANLAALHAHTGDLAAGRALAERVLEARRLHLGPTHAETGESLQLLGALAMAQGDHVAAVEYLRQALAIREQALGPDHPELQMELGQLGSSLSRLGRLDEAEAAFARALRIAEAAPEPQPSLAAAHRCGLAGVALLRGEPSRAEALAREGLAAMQAHGARPPELASCRATLGRAVHADPQRRAEGVAMVRDAVDGLDGEDVVSALLQRELAAWLAANEGSKD
jgi:tetratricopeptide (TPR) repeat protein